jgi:hypothetical protein
MCSADLIVAACEAEWEAHTADCSGFLKAVAHRLGIGLTGQANDIIATLRKTWPQAMDGASAAALAASGQLVIGGLEAAGHGHVVVVVPGPLEHGRYPHAYLGPAPCRRRQEHRGEFQLEQSGPRQGGLLAQQAARGAARGAVKGTTSGIASRLARDVAMPVAQGCRAGMACSRTTDPA